VLRSNDPSAIIGYPQQGGKACRRIEAGPAQPIDRAVAADQRRRFAVADQRIVLDWHCHCTSLICDRCPRNRPRPFDGCRRGLRRHPAIPHRFNEAPALQRLGACLTDDAAKRAVERAVGTEEGALR
jgi:hypothetical protein